MLDLISEFINSSSFTGIATVFTALVAWIVYTHQQSQSKQQAAKVLLTEIRIASERLEQIRDKVTTGPASDFPPVFPTKSWKVYSHLFISDFDHDELDQMNAFYDYGELIEDLARRDNDFFWTGTEERARVHVNMIAQFAVEAMDVNNLGELTQDEYVSQKRDALNGLLDRLNTGYTPSKMTKNIQTLIDKIPNVTTSSTGIKLKKLAKLDKKD